MTTCVFLGPSLDVADAKTCLEAVYLPPARRGDLRQAVQDYQATRLVLIDGFFEQVPSVWHKEILWALDAEVEVWGAASMGALRAAELSAFGMCGYGRIFEAYRDGHFPPFPGPFEDDDEVAVVHGPEELGRITTEAMVDIRATLAAAAEHHVMSTDHRDILANVAKSLFYKHRTWPALLAAGRGAVGEEAIAALEAWLPEGRRSQKRDDAMGLLRHLADAPRAPAPPPFNFERTLIWEIAERAFTK